jgi:hypothetical protein
MSENIMSMGYESTIREYINHFNNEEIVSSAFFLKQVFSIGANKKTIVNFNNLVIKYMPELKEIKIKVKLSNEEYSKYKYNPKVLSYDIYGTTELWFLILEANELHSINQFNTRTIYLFRPDIVEKVSRIINLEAETKNYNAEEVVQQLLN